ncbi:hypothetical protein DIPPA_21319 [Diplonema papillatum]|nr:hypothetical protein DIPPA_21319 [Diplonema papillatum]
MSDLADVEKELVAAEKQGKRGAGWFRRLFNKKSGDDDDDGTDAFGLTKERREKFAAACPLFEARCKQLAAQRAWAEAEKVHGQAAKCYLFLGNRAKCVTFYASAGHCALNDAYRLLNENTAEKTEDGQAAVSEQAADCLKRYVAWQEKAIDEALCGAFYQRAAGLIVELADYLAKDKGVHESTHDMLRSLELYKQAAQHYLSADAAQHATDCLVKVARTLESEARFDHAAEMWLQCVENCTATPILRANAVAFDVSYVLCILRACAESHRDRKLRERHPSPNAKAKASEGDLKEPEPGPPPDCLFEPAHEAVSVVHLQDPMLTRTRKESLLLVKLVAAAENLEFAAFEEAQKEYHSTHTLEAYQMECVRCIKTALWGEKEKKKSFFLPPPPPPRN